jgi:hypothetical protein
MAADKFDMGNGKSIFSSFEFYSVTFAFSNLFVFRVDILG